MQKNLFYFLTSVIVFGISCSGNRNGSNKASEEKNINKEEVAHNQLSDSEIEEGWMLLFDGKTTEGWRGYNKDHFPPRWKVVDGTFFCKGSDGAEAGAVDGGDIIYDEKKFSNFHLKVDYKISKGGNSGIFYLAKEIKDSVIWKTALEFQVLDNERHPGAKLGKNGNRKAGSLYDLIPANPQNAKPAGEWNSAEIIVNKGKVIHKQNGEIVVEYELWTDEWNNLVAGSKNPDWANVAKSGYIALQDHGHDTWFRNIKIREL